MPEPEVWCAEPVFYVLQLQPDVDPHHIKFGWSSDLLQRLARHRLDWPGAVLLRWWPCPRALERDACLALTRVGCLALSRETFDVDDWQQVLKRGEAFFADVALVYRTGSDTPRPTQRRTKPFHEVGSVREYRPGRFCGQVMAGVNAKGTPMRHYASGTTEAEVREKLVRIALKQGRVLDGAARSQTPK